jgi:IS5 family transposase
MLRLYVVQQCFSLSDEGIEDAVYDSQSIRRFAGVDLARENAPDATTVLHFRHLLEAHGLTETIFTKINAHLAEKGLLLKEGTIVDATIIAAPSSTKNASGSRDPEMHQTKKGHQWSFGMKAHIGVDSGSGIVHSVVATSANVNDVTKAHDLLHGEESVAFGDAGYRGVEKRSEAGGNVRWHVAMRPAKKPATSSRSSGLPISSSPRRRFWPVSRTTTEEGRGFGPDDANNRFPTSHHLSRPCARKSYSSACP